MVAFLTPGWCLRRAASPVPSALAAPGFMVYANGRNLSVSPGAAAVGVMIGTFRLADSGNMTPALELEIDPWIMRTRSVWARRRVNVTDSLGSPRSSAITSSTGRPPIPPAALISSRANSAPISPCWPQSTNRPAIGMITPSRTLSPASFAPAAGASARLASSSVTRATPTARRRIPIMSPLRSRERQREPVEFRDVHLATHAPAMDRGHDFRELFGWIGREDEALTSTPLVHVPRPVGELGWNTLLPERQVSREVAIDRFIGARERREVAPQDVPLACLVHPPERVELSVEDLSQAQLLGHVDLRVEETRRLHLALQQRFEPAPEAADRRDLDILERQVLLEPVGHVVVAARHQPDRDWHAAKVFGPSDGRVGAHVDRVPRHAVGVGHELSHTGARVAHAAPRARVADGLRALEERLVLRASLVAAGPRLHLTVIDVPQHLRIEVLRAEVALGERDPLVQPHTRGKDADLREGVHRLGDGNTADRALSIQVYHRAQCSFSSSSTG